VPAARPAVATETETEPFPVPLGGTAVSQEPVVATDHERRPPPPFVTLRLCGCGAAPPTVAAKVRLDGETTRTGLSVDDAYADSGPSV
jgi:hypothetical protein